VTQVFRRAGCGKSARPVRRGDGEPADSSVALRPTLPAIGGRYWVLIFVFNDEKHMWPPMNADERR
jgi:hypothetical protein